MPYKLCDTCEHVKIVDNNIFSKNNEDWSIFPHHIPMLGRTNGSQEVSINLGKKYADRLIYYWACKSMYNNLNVNDKYPDPYENSTNNGLSKLDANGSANVFLNCPQPYKQDNISYISHLHLIVSDKKQTKWTEDFFTQNILCHVNKNQVNGYLKKSNRLIIDALSKEHFDKIHIPSSHNLHYKKAKNMDSKKINSIIKDMIKSNKALEAYVKKNKLKITETPIVVYCYNADCDASVQLANTLFKHGYTNIVDYHEGIKGWLNR